MAKVDPYLRPLYDALYDMVEPEGAQRLLERGTVEVAPLAFMRGRTLNGSFIILDEAQNTTPEQMKMFLTRIGFGSKAVVTGDTTQVDVPGGRSGPAPASSRSSAASTGWRSCASPASDVVRHRIVQDIVDAYERADRPPTSRPTPPGRRRSGSAAVDRRRRLARGGRRSRSSCADEQADAPGRRRAAGPRLAEQVLARRGRPGRRRAVDPVRRRGRRSPS